HSTRLILARRPMRLRGEKAACPFGPGGNWAEHGRSNSNRARARRHRLRADDDSIEQRGAYFGLSRETSDCVRRPFEAGIPTYLVDCKEAGPRRRPAADARLR